jgi:hypothetical protein
LSQKKFAYPKIKNNSEIASRKFNAKYGVKQRNQKTFHLIKCPLCECYFFTKIDLKTHIEIHWKPSAKETGFWMPCDGDPYITKRLRNGGKLIINGWRYFLIDNKILFKKLEEKPKY